MKKLLLILAPITLALSACVTADGTPTAGTATATSLAVGALKIGVQAKCVTEIEKNQYWKVGSKVLSDAKKQEVQTEVCSCVGEKATTSVTPTEVVIAAMDKTSQATLITKVVSNTLNTCVNETLKSQLTK